MIYREPILNNSSNSRPDPFAEIRFQIITLCKLFLILPSFYSAGLYTDTDFVVNSQFELSC